MKCEIICEEKRVIKCMHKIIYPTGLHRLFKTWVKLEEQKCPVHDLYGEISPFECICEEKRNKQKELEKEIKNIL